MSNFRPGARALAVSTLMLGTHWAHAASRVPTHVACVGDSITAGYAASSPAKSYPSQLQDLFGAQVKVMNFGHSGATMLSDGYGDLPYEDQPEYQAATSFVSSAGASAVVDVIIMLGTNDSKNFNWTPSGKPKNDQQFVKDYRAMVQHFLALSPKPVVFLALPPTAYANSFAISGTVIHDEELPLIKSLATELMQPTIDLNTPTANHPELFTDGVHPNDTGYALVAKLMHDGLLQDLSATVPESDGGSAGNVGAGGSSVGGGGSGGSNIGGAAGAGIAGGTSGAGAGGAPSSGGHAGAGIAGAAAAGASVGGAAPTRTGASDSNGCGCNLAKQRTETRASGWARLSPCFFVGLMGFWGLRSSSRAARRGRKNRSRPR